MSCENIVDYILSVKKFTIDNDLNGVKICIERTTDSERIIKHEKIKPSIAFVPDILLHDDANDIVITHKLLQ